MGGILIAGTKINIQNRAPLKKTPFNELPLGAIQPAGWLRDQLEIQAQGLTGKLHDHWEDVGPNSGWLGGTGENWERGPYYLDGLLPLAYLLGDQALIEKVQPWVEWTLNSQREDGWFGPESNKDWWPRMVMLKVLIQYQEATGDERVIPFLTRYFIYQFAYLSERPLTSWGESRGGENILCVQWLYNRTGDEFLLELTDLIHRQTLDWTGLFTDFPFWRYQTQFDHRNHMVNVAMGIKDPALYYLRSGEAIHRDAAAKGIRSLTFSRDGKVKRITSSKEDNYIYEGLSFPPLRSEAILRPNP
ncbi:glycoside hydrolase family 127 protein [Paenibacillus spongiae]|uniref:Glycoside hydrolase family 127 protein n=1 Tax=Paenibacillus spongiae TaxID=2909671 RepID=A0ABY5SG99_9BACL|nr:glycoside hydrolase family 127 protein [Paenibacillus spongiae]UVI32794.1 glycoside hydrolase family 127 protein [Paenibacillus spongiae]